MSEFAHKSRASDLGMMRDTMEPDGNPSQEGKASNPNSITDAGEITQMLRRWNTGDAAALAKLVDSLYPELKHLAELRMSKERPDHTLQPTALVNELYLQLAKTSSITWTNRYHFLVVASRAMRRLLVDHARARNSEKRGSQSKFTALTEDYPAPWNSPERILAITELLDRLEQEELRMAHVIELRYFGGLTFPEIAEILDVDERTAQRDHSVAWAWISSQLRKPASHVSRSMELS